jgi:S-adenosylmethionine:tRNA ribosyltransferase-isomerase
VLLVEPLDGDGTWCCIARGAGRIEPGETVHFTEDFTGIWGDRGSDVYRTIRLRSRGDLVSTITRAGEIPLPPYIRRPDGPSAADRERYQTIFARSPGAIAAPTAGLHFTHELIETLTTQGIVCATLTLLVGPATFLPIRDGSLETHTVPAERYDIPSVTATAIATARDAGARVIAVGTTSVRALESAALPDGTVRAGAGRTDLLIAPGHEFRVVDGLVTNFHLPRSSLMALVAAFAGTDTTLAAYRAAVASGYRFYSFGDAMLIT